MAWAGDVEEQDDYFSCDDMPTSGDEGQDSPSVVEADEVGDSDSDIDADISRTHGPKTTSERRRAQNEVMRAFAANISASITQGEVEQATSQGANEGQLSIRDILASQETTVRITNPRDYQTELFQRAKIQNTIAVLDTGTGKTHIATLLLRHVLEEELETRAKGCTHKIAFFLVRFLRHIFAMIPLIAHRSTQSTWCFNKQMSCDVALIKASRAYAAPWASRCSTKRLGTSFSRPTWLLSVQLRSSSSA
jgi:endoribonuclease Dicer